MSNEIIEWIIRDYGLWGLGIFAVAIIAATVFLKYIPTVILNLPWFSKNAPPLPDSELRNHIFFVNAKHKLRFDIPTLNMLPEKPVTQQVYKDIFYLTVEAYYTGCKHIIETPKLGSLNMGEWGILIRTELDLMFSAYEIKADDFGVPPIILKRYVKWHHTYVELLHYHIEQLSHATMYTNGISRTNTFLMIMNLLLVIMIGDLDKLVQEHTGDMTGIKYRESQLED